MIEEPKSNILKYIELHIQDQDGASEKVQILSLKNHKVKEIHFLTMLPNLKIIDLRNNLLTQMCGFQSCVNLNELLLCENMITKIKRIDNLRQLKVLDLRGNHITEVGRFLSNVPSSLKEIKVPRVQQNNKSNGFSKARYTIISYLAGLKPICKDAKVVDGKDFQIKVMECK